MNLIGMMIVGEYLDKKGRIIRPFDLIKVYHFTGARRRKFYQYFWVVPHAKYGLAINMLNGESDCKNRSITLLQYENRENIEIIQSKHYEL